MAVAGFYSRMTSRSIAKTRFQVVAAMGGNESVNAAGSDESRRRRAVEATLREIEDKQKIRRNAKPSLVGRMRQAGLGWSKQTYFIICGAAGVASFLLAVIVIGIGPITAIGFGCTGGLLLPHLYVSAKRKRRFKSFTAEFPNAVDIVVRGVKAGLPLVDCLKIIATEAQEPVRSEFREIVEDQTLGMPLDEAVERLSERVPLQEANFFAIVIAIQSRTGGSLSEALGNLSKVLRERTKLQAKIRSMSAEAKASGGIIGALPVVVALLVYLTSPNYIALLFTTMTGKLVLAACVLWMGTGILVMRKMINFDF
nr:type II secretion system F family protein [Microvirga makkahensis]